MKRLHEYDVAIGKLPRGGKNLITDVPGVKVGHTTLWEGEGKLIVGEGPIRTGVTAIVPHNGNMFEEKLLAGSFVMNGFGKTAGLIQVNELGTLETPIILTNTMSVPVAIEALTDYSLKQNPDIGIETGTVNAVVGECNDGYLNDIQGRHVKREHVLKAIECAGQEVKEGSVGAGTGVRAFQLKGGIGTSSRVIKDEKEKFTLGVLVQNNFGKKEDLRFLGAQLYKEKTTNGKQEDKGSLMIVVATDAPMSSHQLQRLAKRAPLGMAKTGGYAAHGSGDIVIAFSTANRIKANKNGVLEVTMFNESHKNFNKLLASVVDCTEEAILNSLLMAETMKGRDDNTAEKIDIEKIEKIIEKSK